ncbi:MAG: hypothetical protein LAN70_10395 [Acidobacteriia bacterium]|nr:hypothetical protein [Terriglobia bacterium]
MTVIEPGYRGWAALFGESALGARLSGLPITREILHHGRCFQTFTADRR